MTNFAFDTIHFPPTAAPQKAPPSCAWLDVVGCILGLIFFISLQSRRICLDLSITNPLYFYIWTFQSPKQQESFRNKASLISLGIHWFIFCCCQRRGPWWLQNLWSLRSLSRKRAIKGRASFCLLQKSPPDLTHPLTQLSIWSKCYNRLKETWSHQQGKVQIASKCIFSHYSGCFGGRGSRGAGLLCGQQPAQ